MDPTAYALVAQEKQYPLQVGKNVVGRSSVPVEGVSFINLESPLAAISRMQAFLDIGANGDAWISDCNSTNGTFLSIRPGPGIRLEANRYYQLSPGCRIVFGDVECTLETLTDAPPTQEQQPAELPTPPSRPTRKTEALDTPLSGSAAQTRRAIKSSAATRRSNVPYLDESGSLVTEAATAATASPAAPTRKASRRETPAATPAPAKRAKAEPAPPDATAKRKTVVTPKAATAAAAPPVNAAKKPSPASPSRNGKAAAPPHVCLTGMEADERAAIAKRVRELKGRVVEDITKANLLVVATPPVRTPKFIIAVARRIPVVSVQYICNEKAELDDARRHIVGLKTDQHTYSAAALERVIFRADAAPLLRGVSFNVAGLSSKAKSVASEIIAASGGEVIRGKKSGTVVLGDDDLDKLYDSILRGKVPGSL